MHVTTLVSQRLEVPPSRPHRTNFRRSMPTHSTTMEWNRSNPFINFEYSCESNPAPDAATTYAVRSRITLRQSNTTYSSPTIVLEVSDHLSVHNCRKSQVIVARLVEGVLQAAKNNEASVAEGSTVVAKLFDPKYTPVDWVRPRDPALVCNESKDVEIHAYHKLSSLQGSLVPQFYGEYKYRPKTEAPEVISVLLFQFIPVPALATYANVTLSPHKLEALRLCAWAAQAQIHSHGVYHRDMEAQNLLWNSDTGSLTLVDFENAIFEDRNYFPHLDEEKSGVENALLMDRVKRDDIQILRSMLRDFGVKEEEQCLNISYLVPPVAMGPT
jgi:hypothetical protein